MNRCGQNGDFARALKAVNKSRSPGLTLTLTLVRHSDGIVSSGSSRCRVEPAVSIARLATASRSVQESNV